VSSVLGKGSDAGGGEVPVEEKKGGETEEGRVARARKQWSNINREERLGRSLTKKSQKTVMMRCKKGLVPGEACKNTSKKKDNKTRGGEG